jgi:hypothetical protein
MCFQKKSLRTTQQKQFLSRSPLQIVSHHRKHQDLNPSFLKFIFLEGEKSHANFNN